MIKIEETDKEVENGIKVIERENELERDLAINSTLMLFI